VYLKRDDRYEHPSGARGAKARALQAILDTSGAGHRGVVAAVSRNSSIPDVVARVAHWNGLTASIHTSASANIAREFALAEEAGAAVHYHRPGYLSVSQSRAYREVTASAGALLFIPLGLECAETVNTVCREVIRTQFPPDVLRIVIAAGSGVMLAGFLRGAAVLWPEPKTAPPVVAVCVGANPEDRVSVWAPFDWRERVTFVNAFEPFMSPAGFAETLGYGLKLDPYYEAKCVPFIRPGDLFWISATRTTCQDQ
jgi:1-aminocyclopropane-1-carboxylate deaminase/D-cysteine desulfhydrase-like pyridoxal-dependent ACC family enzyme